MAQVKKDRAGLHVKLLGGFEAGLATGQPLILPTRKAQALLAYLATRPGQPHARDKLAALLWADRGDAQARDSLRHTLVQLRKALPARACLIAERGTVVLDTARIEVDVTRFEARAAAGTAEDLAEAAEIYQGDFLDGFVLREPLFEEWLMAERERLLELAVGTLGRLLEQQRAASHAEPAIRTALRLLALDAGQERAHRALMQLYVQQGRRAAALRQYQTCVSMLRRELGTEPEAETRQLYQEIVRRRDDVPRGGARGVARPSATRALAAPGQPVAVRPEPGSVETPLIGRSTELATLCTAFDEARWGRGRMVAIVGEAGIGKTRLVAELVRTAAAHNVRVLTAQCYESEQILPFGPWVEALRAGQVVPDDPALLALEPAWRAELARLFPEIAATDLPAPTDDARRLFESVSQLIRSLAMAQPVLVVLEDVHWADEMTVRLVAFLGRRIAADRVLVAMTAREEDLAEADALRRVLAEFRGAGHVAELALSPLSRSDTARLVRCLTAAGSDSQVVGRVEEHAWAASTGNPFVVVETVRALREGMTLQTGPHLSLPQRVRDVIAGRVERVSDRSRQLLSVAAVIGREFNFALLQLASGLTDHAAAEGVEELVRRRMLHTVRDGFDVTHDRIREVVYGGLLPPRRRLLHEQIVEAIERLHGDRITGHVEQFAHHAVRSGVWDRTLLHERRRLHAPIVEPMEGHLERLSYHAFRGELWDKAAAFSRQAGSKAIARSASRQAVACFERALAALDRLEKSTPNLEQALDVHLDLQSALVPLGLLDRMLASLLAAERLAERLGGQKRLGWVHAYMGHCFWWVGEPARAVESCRRSLAIAEDTGDSGLAMVSNVRLGQACFALGRYRQVVHACQAAMDLLGAESTGNTFDLPAMPSVVSLSFMSRCKALLGDFASGIETGKQAGKLAEQAAHPYSMVIAYWALGDIYITQGQCELAVGLLEQAARMCSSGEFALMVPIVDRCLGEAYCLSGRSDEAVRLLESAVRDLAAVKFMPALPGAYATLGEAYLIAGRLDEALRTAEQARELCAAHEQAATEAGVVRILGEIGRARSSAPAETKALFADGWRRAQQLENRPLMARCALGLGRVERAAGQRASEWIGVAASMLKEMGMTRWLSESQADVAVSESSR